MWAGQRRHTADGALVSWAEWWKDAMDMGYHAAGPSEGLAPEVKILAGRGGCGMRQTAAAETCIRMGGLSWL